MPRRSPISCRAPALEPAQPDRSTDFGALPEWDLSDLYSGMDSPAFREDLIRAEAECKAFADTYRGRLDALARAIADG